MQHTHTTLESHWFLEKCAQRYWRGMVFLCRLLHRCQNFAAEIVAAPRLQQCQRHDVELHLADVLVALPIVAVLPFHRWRRLSFLHSHRQARSEFVRNWSQMICLLFSRNCVFQNWTSVGSLEQRRSTWTKSSAVDSSKSRNRCIFICRLAEGEDGGKRLSH